MRGKKGRKPLSHTTWLETFALLADYRREMPVTEFMMLPSPSGFESEFYLCPRCHISVEWEFMSFCNRCGQRLGWKHYKKARRIPPGYYSHGHT